MNNKNNPNFDFYSFGDDKTPPSQQPPIDREPEDFSCYQEFSPMLDAAALYRTASHHYSRLGFALAVAILLWFVLSAVVLAIGQMISPALGASLMFTNLAGTLPLYFACTPLLYLMISSVPSARPEPKKLSISHFLVLFLMAQGLMWAGNFVGEGLMGIMGRLTGVDFYNQLNETVGLPIWFVAILTGVLAPLFEEIIFRKLLLDRMIPYGETAAILVNGLLFGLFHGNFYQFFYAASLGMLLSFVYVMTGKWWHTVLLHIGVNFMGGILPTILLQRLDYERYLALDLTNLEEMEAFMAEYGPEMSALSLFSMAQIAMALAGIFLLIVKFKSFKVQLKSSRLPLGTTMKAALLNPGSLCAIGICSLLIVANLLSYF